ncbi:MAG: Rieske (2Fe-2S) protein [Nitrospirae bacterium]|nr:Rieske (2Fe-2S) protein [Nitrospirota bacterium]
MKQIGFDFLNSNEMAEIEVEGKSVLIANINGTYYAVGNRCPHLMCKLHKGQLEGTTVKCPCHGSTFDVTNGKLIKWLNSISNDLVKILRFIGWARDLAVYTCTKDGQNIIIK